MPVDGQIKTLYEDKDKTKAIFPRTLSNAVTTEDGKSVETALNEKQSISDTRWEPGEGENSTQLKGESNHARGEASVAEGINTTANATGTHAEGNQSRALANFAHVEGNQTTAGGQASHAEGNNTSTNNQAEHAEGKYNYSHIGDTTADNTQHSVGIGHATQDMSGRKNAFEIMQNGDAYLINVGGYNGADYKSAKRLQDVVNDKVDRTINGTNGTAEIFNERDGGGAHFIHNDGSESFVGVNDGGQTGLMAQIYADNRDEDGNWVGSRINVYNDKIYYTSKQEVINGVEKDDEDYEILVKKDLFPYSLISETGNKINLEFNTSTYSLIAKLYDKNGILLSTSTGVEISFKDAIIDIEYNSNTKELITTTKDGSKKYISLAAILDGFATQTYVAEQILNVKNWVESKGYAFNNDLLIETERAKTAENNKVDKIEGKGLSTNDFTTEEKTKLAGLNNYDDTKLTVKISNIESKIPAEASSINKLVDKDFVNSSIASNTATFRGSYDVIDDLGLTLDATKEQVAAGLLVKIGKVVTNDYTFVFFTNQTTGLTEKYDRYKYVSATESWIFEYTLNNSSFTAAQWETISSGLTKNDVEKLSNIEAGAEVNIQSNWTENDSLLDAYIKNKPFNKIGNGLSVDEEGNLNSATFVLNKSLETLFISSNKGE